MTRGRTAEKYDAGIPTPMAYHYALEFSANRFWINIQGKVDTNPPIKKVKNNTNKRK
jgi:hypothetical protein